jgi:hypothetical protein
MMKDYLLDLIQHTNGLGVIELVKINGTQAETKISALSEDRNVIVNGTFKTPIIEFDGVFGMPNLSKLKTILSFDDYGEDSTIALIREDKDGELLPASIHFETASKDFINDYRLMKKGTVEDRVPAVTFKGANWNVEFAPTVAGIMRLKKQASANSEEVNFKTTTENGDLKVYFGDHSTHSGNFVFHPGVTGTLTRPWQWPVKVFLSIMDLPGDKTVRISDDGAVEITVDSGLAIWQYLLPAQAK